MISLWLHAICSANDFRFFSVRLAAVAVAEEGERELGWGRVRLFLNRLGKTADSRSLSLAHCDLTATDLLELGG